MKKILHTTILFLLLVPMIAFSGNVYLKPANFSSSEVIKEGKNYDFVFYVSNNSDEEMTISSKIDCIVNPNREGTCGSDQWFKIKPNGDFILRPRESKEILVRLKIPKDVQNADYLNYLIVKPTLTSSIKEGQTTFSPSMGSRIAYTKEGKISFWWKAIYWWQASVGNKLMLGAGKIESVIPYEALIVGTLFVGLSFGALKIIKKVKNRRKIALKQP